MAVCPAGEDGIGPFLDDRKHFLAQAVKPLQDKVETIYVVPSSDAESHVEKKFPHKTIKGVGNGLRPGSVAGFLLPVKRGPPFWKKIFHSMLPDIFQGFTFQYREENLFLSSLKFFHQPAVRPQHQGNPGERKPLTISTHRVAGRYKNAVIKGPGREVAHPAF